MIPKIHWFHENYLLTKYLLHSVEITEIYSDRDQKKKFRENSVI